MIPLKETTLFSETQLKVLSRLAVKDVRDIFYYLPRTYIDRTMRLDLRTAHSGDYVTVVGTIVHSEMRFAGKRRFTAKIDTNGFTVYATFFNAGSYLQKALVVGQEIACWGKLDVYGGRLSFMHPEWELLTQDKAKHTGRIVPIYRITEAMRKSFLTVRTLSEKIEECLNRYASRIADYLPKNYISRYNLLPMADAIRKVHFPQSIDETEDARRRLAFDELVLFSVLNEEKKAAIRKIDKGFSLRIDTTTKKEIDNLINALPFKLTRDQEKAFETLEKNSEALYPVNHLLMGDVGSGKTLVALLVALVYMRCDAQVAYLAPTEILARQHYLSFLNILPKGSFEGVELLLGKDGAKERRAKLERLSRGESYLAIGTHALLQDDVQFQNLRFIIIDEQHRFGVEQREKLRAKGKNPDLLSMTATPIPRTLTLAYYGDLEPIYIKEKPKTRIKIDTRILSEEMLGGIYNSVKKYVSQGRQVYIVYPIIDESENSDMASLLSEYSVLEKTVFPDLRLGLLHGRLTGDEKESAMQKFREGLIQVLVATTVVEVGIDVPNANVMIIRNPERFGLSQLHQLRGRVGRGEHQSFCILVEPDKITPEGKERLSAMVKTDDGFELAQIDFELRGPGETTGLKQSGASEFRVADLRRHAVLFEKARELLVEMPQIQTQLAALKNIRQTLEKGLVLFGN